MNAATALMNRVMLALSEAGLTVWRNNTAQGWGGKSFELRAGEVYRAKGGERVVLDARPIKAGLCKGASDLVGAESVIVTPDMVGRRMAVFHAWEVKHGKGRLSTEQKDFLAHVDTLGGVSAEVRSPDDALQAIFSRRTK